MSFTVLWRKEALARLRSPNHYAALGVPVDFEASELKKAYRALSLRLHPDRNGGSTELFAIAAAAHDCLADAACRRSFDRGEDVTGYQPSLAEAVERHYYAENFPFEPFGDPWDDYRDGAERRERSRARQRSRVGLDAAGNASTALPAADGGLKEEL